jgi:hypothetical protein
MFDSVVGRHSSRMSCSVIGANQTNGQIRQKDLCVPGNHSLFITAQPQASWVKMRTFLPCGQQLIQNPVKSDIVIEP